MKKLMQSALLAVAALGFSQQALADTTIYYDNSASGWSQVNIHYWGGPETSWPGVAMTSSSENIWEFTFTDASGISGFLFCNGDGSDQTADVSGKPAANHLYKGTGGKGKVSDEGEYNPDPSRPVITADPASGTKFIDNVTVTLSVTPEAKLYYTTDGTTATASSTPYTAPIVLTESTTISVYALTADNKDNVRSFSYTKRHTIPVGAKNLITDYYKVNPDGKVGTRRTVNMSFANQKSSTALSNWSDADLIAQGVARDVCMAIKGTHERPVIDSYAIYASYDNENLYLGAQFVYTVWDLGGEGKQPGESKPYNMDGAMIWAFDLDPEDSFDGRINGQGPIWNQDKKGMLFQNGVDAVWIGSTKPGVGQPGFFTPTPDGHASYSAPYLKSIPGSYYGYADGLLPSIDHIWGQARFGYDPENLLGNDGFADLKDEVAETAHTFYEWKFPLSVLGVTADFIASHGIGVMYLDQYGTSPVGGTPYDPSYFDNVSESYSADKSTSKEKEDDDIITFAPARIGKLAHSTSGVDEIAIENADEAEPVFYTLQGIRVAEPTTGIYIKVTGKKAEKVMVR